MKRLLLLVLLAAALSAETVNITSATAADDGSTDLVNGLGGTPSSAGSYLHLWAGQGGGVTYWSRIWMRFDTSSIPAGAVITSATLYLYASSRDGTFNGCVLPGSWVAKSSWPPTAYAGLGSAGSLPQFNLLTVPGWNAVPLTTPSNLRDYGIQFQNTCSFTDQQINAYFVARDQNNSFRPYVAVTYVLGGPKLIITTYEN